MNRAKIIAEVGCNHQGNLICAFSMIEDAARSGADIVKFQKRENRLLLSPEEYDAPHPVEANSFGDTYGDHREFLEFTNGGHYKLKEKCEEEGVEYSTSVWDRQSAWEIKQIQPKHIKIPSACNLDKEIYQELWDWEGTLHVSLGMTTEEEQEQVVTEVLKNYVAWSPILYTCTSGYPVKPSETFLLDIPRLREDLWDGLGIGFSGHHMGINLDPAAYALGAEYIERHFTFDKKAKGTDHCASLTAYELTMLRVRLDEVWQAMREKYGMPAVEAETRAKLKRKV